MPAYVGSWLVALQYIPSYVTSLESATMLHQNGCASIRKSFTTARVTLLSVNAIGRPSPSSRTRVAKYDHQGWPFPLIPPDACASMTKSCPVTTNQDAWFWRNITRYVLLAFSQYSMSGLNYAQMREYRRRPERRHSH